MEILTVLAKIIKPWLLTLLPLFFTSYISPEDIIQGKILPEGTYDLRITESDKPALKGSIVFDSTVETAANGKTYSIIKLHLQNAQPGPLQSMGFLISRQNNAEQLTTGIYRISKNSDGFLHYFDGVFGFASSAVPGEPPFFAADGRIIITHSGTGNLTGKIEVVFQNMNSKQLSIKGIFKAIKGKLR